MLFKPFPVEQAIDDAVPALALILVIIAVEEAVAELFVAILIDFKFKESVT